jgi:hypothetical protein
LYHHGLSDRTNQTSINFKVNDEMGKSLAGGESNVAGKDAGVSSLPHRMEDVVSQDCYDDNELSQALPEEEEEAVMEAATGGFFDGTSDIALWSTCQESEIVDA